MGGQIMPVVIGSGFYRSRVIDVPSYLEVPTKSVVRMALGNALNDKLPNAVCLDLFAGSGAVGIEFISRGAEKCYFVDENQEATTVIRNNLAKLKCNQGEILHGDALKALEVLADKAVKLDIVFIDPPYAQMDLYPSTVQYLLDHALLRDGAAVVVEYETEPKLPFNAFLRYKTYNYGRSHLMILWR